MQRKKPLLLKVAAAAEAKKKAAAEAAASTDVDDLFGGLANAKNAPKSGSGAGAAAAGKGGGKKSGASGADISGYLGQITGAIQSKFMMQIFTKAVPVICESNWHQTVY